MVFAPGPIPDPTTQFDDARYANDVPFNVKQTQITHARHRWYQVIAIGAFGTAAGQFAKTNGLGAGLTMRIQFEHKPDFISISIAGQTASTGRCVVFRGDPGGDGIPLGQSGSVTLPAPEGGIITIVNVGTTATFGVVIAHAGYDAQLGIQCGL